MVALVAYRSISWLISDAARRDPDRPAITCGDETVSRLELDLRTNRMARAFAAMGVTQGSLVTIALPNSVAFLEAAVAAWKLGAIPQPVSYRLPDRERQAIVELADSALVVGAEPSAHPTRRVVRQGWEPDAGLSDDPLPDIISPSWKAPTSGGSTGRPKLILSGAPGTFHEDGPGMKFYRIKPNGVSCAPGPLYHSAPFQVSSLSLFGGGHVVLMSKFDAEETLRAVDTYRPDLLLLVPTMMSRIWRLPEAVRTQYDLSSLEVIWHMAAPCPVWLKQAWIDWLGGEKIYELYAGTEAQAVTVVRGDEWSAHPGTVGRVSDGEMRVLDPETHEDLPPGQIGEIFLRAKGKPTYHYRGAEPHRIDDGWESLGDMGWFDAEGYLFLGDRKADMILSGGANVYPAETESALLEHHTVVSCAVIGLPDEDLGKRVHGVIQLTPDHGLDDPDAEMRAFLAERLVRYKIPRTFEYVDTPVRDDAGKVRRSGLVAERG